MEQAQSDAVLEANYYLCGITLVNNNEVFKVSISIRNCEEVTLNPHPDLVERMLCSSTRFINFKK